MYYNLTDEYDKVRHTIHDCIENALHTPISGVVDAEITYGGTIGGYFLDATDEPYLYELDSEGVIFAPHDDSIRIDAAKGKKCPGGYWIPRNKECKRANMSPSAKKSAGGLKGALAAGLVAAGAAGAAGYAAKRSSDNKKAAASQAASQRAAAEAEARKPMNRLKAAAGDRRVQAGAALGVGAAALGGRALKRRGEENKEMKDLENLGVEGVDRKTARSAIDERNKAERTRQVAEGNTLRAKASRAARGVADKVGGAVKGVTDKVKGSVADGRSKSIQNEVDRNLNKVTEQQAKNVGPAPRELADPWSTPEKRTGTGGTRKMKLSSNSGTIKKTQRSGKGQQRKAARNQREFERNLASASPADNRPKAPEGRNTRKRPSRDIPDPWDD